MSEPTVEYAGNLALNFYFAAKEFYDKHKGTNLELLARGFVEAQEEALRILGYAED